jgi:hypothetical protein
VAIKLNAESSDEIQYQGKSYTELKLAVNLVSADTRASSSSQMTENPLLCTRATRMRGSSHWFSPSPLRTITRRRSSRATLDQNSSKNFPTRVKLRLLAFVFIAFPPYHYLFCAEGLQTDFFPNQILFPRFLADGAAQQMSVNKDLYSRRWLGSIGGMQRILQLKNDNLTLQFGVGASVKATLIKMPAVVQVVTVDFFIDFPIEFQLSKNILLRTGWGHYSGHFADDGIELLKLSSVNYAKDYTPILCAYKVNAIGGFVYGGVRLDYYSIPKVGKNWNIQLGVEGGNMLIADGVRLYGTIDIKARSEVAWATTQSYQLGVKLLEHNLNAIRVAYTYRTGIADQGQFYRERINLSLMGVYLDF